MGLFSFIKNVFPKHTFLGKLMGSKNTEGINIGEILKGHRKLGDELKGAVPAFINAQMGTNLPVDHTNHIIKVMSPESQNPTILVKQNAPMHIVRDIENAANSVGATVKTVTKEQEKTINAKSILDANGDGKTDPWVYGAVLVLAYLIFKKR